MTQKLTGNDFDIASPVHGEINKNPWNKDEREQKTKFLPSLCFSGPEINNLPVKSAQSNIIIGSKELGLRPDGTNVQKVGCWQGPVRGKVGWSERRSLWEVCFFLDRLEGSRFGHQKNHPQWKYPPKTQDGRLDVLELRQLFAQLHFELRPEELHLIRIEKKFNVLGWWKWWWI